MVPIKDHAIDIFATKFNSSQLAGIISRFHAEDEPPCLFHIRPHDLARSGFVVICGMKVQCYLGTIKPERLAAFARA
jgi:hypothetical protein